MWCRAGSKEGSGYRYILKVEETDLAAISKQALGPGSCEIEAVVH